MFHKAVGIEPKACFSMCSIYCSVTLLKRIDYQIEKYDDVKQGGETFFVARLAAKCFQKKQCKVHVF